MADTYTLGGGLSGFTTALIGTEANQYVLASGVSGAVSGTTNPFEIETITENGNTIYLEWSRVATLNTYSVYQKKAGETSFSLVATTKQDSIIFRNLEYDTKYTYKISFVDTLGTENFTVEKYTTTDEQIDAIAQNYTVLKLDSYQIPTIKAMNFEVISIAEKTRTATGAMTEDIITKKYKFSVETLPMNRKRWFEIIDFVKTSNTNIFSVFIDSLNTSLNFHVTLKTERAAYFEAGVWRTDLYKFKITGVEA